ncbi:hypothetical protein SAMN05421767_10652 [Granulicatella balaenopterae]|uniref:Uncharacterized protein n=1 Tax=Granulicatella balaenopterae TaxID=137733 RepID=A0A1H9IPN9_9LACT|nr:hypothetical protein SAMN05421767_10652 [Granulicatella balaenopterae]
MKYINNLIDLYIQTGCHYYLDEAIELINRIKKDNKPAS